MAVGVSAVLRWMLKGRSAVQPPARSKAYAHQMLVTRRSNSHTAPLCVNARTHLADASSEPKLLGSELDQESTGKHLLPASALEARQQSGNDGEVWDTSLTGPSRTEHHQRSQVQVWGAGPKKNKIQEIQYLFMT